MNEYRHSDLTQQIIGIFYDVYNALGYGFLEKLYENAMALRLRAAGLGVRQQQPVHVFFDGAVVGEYFADLVVNDCVLIELKAAETVAPAYEAQLVNYLRATGI